MNLVTRIKIISITSTIFLGLICFFVSCKKSDSSCYTVPAVASLNFRLLDSTGQHDLFLTNRFNFDSLKAFQGCNSIALLPTKTVYDLPVTGAMALSFALNGTRSPGLAEPTNCYQIFLKYNSQVSDTIQWSYHIEMQGNCSLQIMDGVSDNNSILQKVDDGNQTYYAIKK